MNSKHRLRQSAIALLIFLVIPVAAFAQSIAGIRVIEEEAIPFTRFLSKADFDKRFPGEVLPDAAKLDTGWYVIYEHESLSYYFGPILLESTGQDYLDQLEATVGAAVAQRSSIEGYRLELSYEPQTSSNDTSSSPPEANQTPSFPSTPQPAPKPSIFDTIKRWFGF